jgi:hypothetical protein
MFYQVVLISCGKLMYFGKRREMLPYFAFIEYPCPAYKNPSDYYRKSINLSSLFQRSEINCMTLISFRVSIFCKKLALVNLFTTYFAYFVAMILKCNIECQFFSQWPLPAYYSSYCSKGLFELFSFKRAFTWRALLLSFPAETAGTVLPYKQSKFASARLKFYDLLTFSNLQDLKGTFVHNWDPIPKAFDSIVAVG